MLSSISGSTGMETNPAERPIRQRPKKAKMGFFSKFNKDEPPIMSIEMEMVKNPITMRPRF